MRWVSDVNGALNIVRLDIKEIAYYFGKNLFLFPATSDRVLQKRGATPKTSVERSPFRQNGRQFTIKESFG
ncbi:hypothetical protein ATY89_08765 [Sulfolobus acidocaldarius]|uniref:Uncharacterized protein n=3 Tax=Sulfolobus acidocaldarius TaxID=2285 RepID=A0A0U3H528_9CREN|nr:hypothetical protein [Sulfolobus acidocaldarius]AGE71788.1 hypothetical protein SacN8_09140 [Sulfolobus acidocaldarius N8]AGE74060.1 hypothetical protein SacRon12I_09165 [Sulfolobus acidocaldarius Ron12/I]WCM35673.1 hypothetical protein GO597_10190 [Sulfolobus acidocaldarius DSM 639]ALU30016.1 hypothetical protein ATY89_08765 [Sulfolobus acidocaldarius]ALU30706.1 hypothetical protein ATZ20_00175 [Sulfolobus acidocaldarius]